jgi:hypothetical protein
MYSVALANRQMTINEVRALEDLPGFGPDFNVPGIPPMQTPEDEPEDEPTQLTLPMEDDT